VCYSVTVWHAVDDKNAKKTFINEKKCVEIHGNRGFHGFSHNYAFFVEDGHFVENVMGVKS